MCQFRPDITVVVDLALKTHFHPSFPVSLLISITVMVDSALKTNFLPSF